MSKMVTTRARACAGKHPHPTEKAAQSHMWRLVQAGAALVRLNVYRCPHAPKGRPHWHVGHTPKPRAVRR